MDQRGVDVLLIHESQRGWCHLAWQLEQLGRHCWFASTTEEVRAILDRHPLRLVLSTRPVRKGSVLMRLLRGPERSVFYSFPVEDGCLWFQALPEIIAGQRLSALRPSEFMSILRDLIARLWCSSPRFSSRKEQFEHGSEIGASSQLAGGLKLARHGGNSDEHGTQISDRR
jgi:hypothetical protein